MRNTLFCLLCLTLTTCSQPSQSRRAFYYWKTAYNLDAADATILEEMGVDTLYVRFFDIRYSPERGQPQPVGMIAVNPKAHIPKTVVPVVFLTQETLQKLAPHEISPLALNLVEQVFHLSQQFPGAQLPELQLDCDWTPGTRDTYFQLLQAVEALLKKRPNPPILSATIRLNQLRHVKENGIPPVARGALMAYHTSSPLEFNTSNSILDLSLAQGYLANAAPYPLPLDVAMPIFAWGIQYDANQKFIRLLNDISEQDLADNKFWRPRDGIYEALADTYLADKRVMLGDLIELEQITMAQVEALKPLLKKHAAPDGTLLVFDYDRKHLNRMTPSKHQSMEAFLANF